MLNAGQAGFVHAPVTKTIIATAVLSTVLGSIIESQTRLTLHLEPIVNSLQIWRLFTHNFVFTTPGELIFGIVLIYFFRQFERQLGSSRFTAFAIITSTIYTAVLVTIQSINMDLIAASGPYCLIFGGMVHFFFETPKIYHFQLLGAVNLSDKTFAYLLAVQLIFSTPPRSLISCAAGVLAGVCYRLPPVREHADMPDAVVQFCSSYVLPWLGTAPRPTLSRRNRAVARHARVNAAASGLVDTDAQIHDLPTGEAGSSDLPSGPVLLDENVETLVSMGFSRDDSVTALQRTNDDVQAATDLLLRATGDT